MAQLVVSWMVSDGSFRVHAINAVGLGSPFQIMVQAQIAVDIWMQLFIEDRAPAVHREVATFL
jgi:hypothetical protein